MPAFKGIIDNNNVVVDTDLRGYNGKQVIIKILDFKEDRKSNPSGTKLHMTYYKENDGSFVAVLEELDLIENANTKEECMKSMIMSIKDYANDFCKDFDFWYSENRQSHIPIVMKVLSSTDAQIKDSIICQTGEI